MGDGFESIYYVVGRDLSGYCVLFFLIIQQGFCFKKNGTKYPVVCMLHVAFLKVLFGISYEVVSFFFQTLCSEVYDMQISEAVGGVPATGAAAEPCRFPKLEECAHFHYERVQLPQLTVTLQTSMDQSLHSQHSKFSDSPSYTVIFMLLIHCLTNQNLVTNSLQ